MHFRLATGCANAITTINLFPTFFYFEISLFNLMKHTLMILNEQLVH